MKKITTILLILIALSCSGQVKDIECYSDSALIQRINFVVDSMNNDKAIAILDNDNSIDSLNNLISVLKENASIIPSLIESDTLDIEIFGGGASIKIEKKSYNIRMTLLHESKRIYITYLPNDFDFMIQDSTFTRITQHLDLR